MSPTQNKCMMQIVTEIQTNNGDGCCSGGSDGMSSISDGSMVFSEDFLKKMEEAVALCTKKSLVGK